MRKPVRRIINVGFCTYLLAAPAIAAQNADVRIGRVAGAPDIDLLARGFDEGSPGLAGFARVEGFVQQVPVDGLAATQETVVYLGYDDRALYAVFVATDDEPDRVRARLAPRETLGADDFVTLLLDTDGDRRRAYAFRSNPRGVQWDALWTEGQGFDTSFDAVWTSRARLTTTGYVVSLEIPFRSLRFDARESGPWGIVLSRDIPRDQGEVAYWPRVSSDIQGTLTQSAELTGIEGVSPGRNIQLIPYTTGRAFRALDRRAIGGPRFSTESSDFDAGVDLKTVIDDRFVFDLTANPDFSQVESDQPQVTVNQRFELFFPERRPFFTENADYFRTPISVLFTRRIADPQFGARFTGKAGGWSLGALAIDDQAPGRLAPPGSQLEGARAGFTVARLSRDLGDFSRLGVIYASRQFADGHNRVSGVDARVRLDDHWSATGQLVGSRTRDAGEETRTGSAASASLSRSGRQFTYFGNYTDIGPDFEARAGFVPRTDQRRMSHFASYFFRPQKTLISWGPEVFIVRLWDHAGNLLDEITEASLEWSFTGGTNLEVNYRVATDRLGPEDHPSLTELRALDVSFWDIEFGTSYFGWLQLSGNLRFGNQINLSPIVGQEPSEADWRQLNLGLSLRPSTQLRIDNTVLWTGLDEPVTGRRVFSDRILRTRWNWQFTRELSVRAILQYDHTSTDPLLTSLETRKNLNADLLITYRLNPWTAVYAGVNANGQNIELIDQPGGDRRIGRVDDLRGDAHQFFIKASYLLQF